MTAGPERTAKVPPRVFVRTAWLLHRAPNIFSKLELTPEPDSHRRVLAALAHLREPGAARASLR